MDSLEKIWKDRKKLLNLNGWIYNRSTEMWDSSDSSAEFSYDLKNMNNDEFSKKVLR